MRAGSLARMPPIALAGLRLIHPPSSSFPHHEPIIIVDLVRRVCALARLRFRTLG
jgi:hypothetical protein